MAAGIANPTAVIAASGATSNAVELNGVTLVGMLFPAVFNGTSLTFTVCDSADGTFVGLQTIAAALNSVVAAAKYVALDPVNFYGVKFVKLVSGSTESAERTVKLFVREIR